MDPFREPYYHDGFCYVTSDWYETLDNYQPRDEQLLRRVRSIVPASWRFYRSDVWIHVSAPGVQLPPQGWKIHVSATPANCVPVLERAAKACVRMSVPFKFLADAVLVGLATGIGWPRPQAGKFITIYPKDDAHFRSVIEELYLELRDFEGPYVLSDTRYRDSRVISYRYGGFSAERVLTVRGDKEHVILDPDGRAVADLRLPYYHQPSWVTDPVNADNRSLDIDSEPIFLNNGRYRVDRVLRTSVRGGVYVAIDYDSGESVLIKEARPGIGLDQNGDDAIDRLKKEYRLLEKLRKTGISPKPIELFWDWEHLFLVEEFLVGKDLLQFITRANPLGMVSPTERLVAQYLEKIRRIWISIAECLETMHAHGIVAGDLSTRNIFIDREKTGQVRIIDLEGSWEVGVDKPNPWFGTPGFTPPNGVTDYTDDYYQLAAVLLGTLHPINSISELNPSAAITFTETLCADLGLPTEVRDLIVAGLDSDRRKRPSPARVAEVLRKLPQFDAPKLLYSVPSISNSPSELRETVDKLLDYVVASAAYHRRDRLFPADPLVFVTNPLSIAYGATGVAYGLARIRCEVPSRVLTWILSQSIHPDDYPPGLYVGSAGIAWALWDMGLHDVAVNLLRSARSHPLLWKEGGIFYGCSGYGLACLHFYAETNGQEWLDEAVKVGEWLLSTAIESDAGLHWTDESGETWLGYGKGASGIALFLLYLSIAANDDRFLEGARRAIAHDISFVRESRYTPGALQIPQGRVHLLDQEGSYSPYWINGSAGVCTVLLRMWVATGEEMYLTTLKGLVRDSIRKYVSFPGLFKGLAGLGNLLLDVYTYTGLASYLDYARWVADGITYYAIPRDSGLAMPGEQLRRISTDFGTGSTGIALFLHRLVNAERDPGNFNFTVDKLLDGKRRALAGDQMAVVNPTAS